MEDREALNLAAVEHRSSPETPSMPQQLPGGGSKPRKKGLLAQPREPGPGSGLCMVAGGGRTVRLDTQSEEGREGAGQGWVLHHPVTLTGHLPGWNRVNPRVL